MKNASEFIKNNLNILLSAIVAAIAAGLYCWWMVTTDSTTVGGAVMCAVTIALLAWGIILCIPRGLRFFSGEDAPLREVVLGERSSKRSRLHPWLKIVLLTLLGRAVLMIIAYLFSIMIDGYQDSFFESIERIWTKTYSNGLSNIDAQHYFSIAENWYPTEGDARLTLVFLPLYPILISAFNLIFADSFVSGFVINTLCSCGIAVAIYELALCDMGRRSAGFTVFCTFALPTALFFVTPMSEPLFFLLSVLTLLTARKQKFWLAALFGALASFTRSLGIVLIIPVAAEAAAACVRHYREHGKEKLNGRIVTACISTLCVGLGTFGYLLINKLLWGNWFQFLIFQRENWNQSLSPFFDTPVYQLEYLIKAIEEGSASQIFGLRLPNLLAIFGALILFVLAAKRMRTSYAMYYAAYFVASTSTSWLLSAPRYLGALAVLPIAIALLLDRGDDRDSDPTGTRRRMIVGVVLMLSQLIYLYLFVRRYAIY